MAACAITITGTSGSVDINYLLGGIPQKMTGSFGQTLYINDTATAITYTNISGDAAATSGCVTITNLPSTCYIISWGIDYTPLIVGTSGYIQNSNFVFTHVVLDTELAIAEVNYADFNPEIIAIAINNLEDYRIQAVATKVVSGSYTKELFVVIKVVGAYVPQIKINNPLGNHKLYLKGVVSGDCLPVDYTPINVCTSPAP